MNNDFSLANVMAAMEQSLLVALDRQITDGGRADCGAYVNPESGLGDVSHVCTGPILVGCGMMYLAGERLGPAAGGRVSRAEWLHRAGIAADFLLCCQPASGLIDLKPCNYDSSPDTAFLVQMIAVLLTLGRRFAAGDAAWASVAAKLEMFVRKAVVGLKTGGFHTPNHRWVVASALAQAKALFAELDVAAVVDAYIAEDVDLDADGAYQERSIGVYDAVTNRSLLLLAEHWGWAAADDAASKNLTFNLHMLHADGSAETGLSHRQDHGTKVVPFGLAANYLEQGVKHSLPAFTSAARFLWAADSAPRLPDLWWLCTVLLLRGEAPAVPAAVPEKYANWYPANGLLRVRDGRLSASAFRGTRHLLAVRFGQAELSSVRISQSYMGVGQFVADSTTVEGDRAILRSEGTCSPRRPGYELPLGRPVPRESANWWAESCEHRDLRPMAPATSTLEVRTVPGGLELHYRTLNGPNGVLTQLSLDFPAGGVWETSDSCLCPVAGQLLFLKAGWGRMMYGQDAITISPGAHGHRTWGMRDADAATKLVRVLLTFQTPVDHVLHIAVGRQLAGVFD